MRLLRVLQEKEVERVGGSQVMKVDIRIISATHRSLETLVEEGRFREDLYYRLGVYPIHIPPLRERRADIPAFVEHFVERKARELGFRTTPDLGPGVIDRLINYEWPGNVREVAKVVERALIQSGGKRLSLDDMALRSRAKRPDGEPAVVDGSQPPLQEAAQRLRALPTGPSQVGRRKSELYQAGNGNDRRKDRGQERGCRDPRYESRHVASSHAKAQHLFWPGQKDG